MVFVGFLFLCSKVKADAINDLQYHGTKMATISDMFVKKMGLKLIFEMNSSTNTRDLEKLRHKLTENGKF